MKRYDLTCSSGYMHQSPDGEWVAYKEAEVLQTELSALKKQVAEAEQSARNWKFDCDQNVKWGLSMKALAEHAEAELAALKKDARLAAEHLKRVENQPVYCKCEECETAWAALQAAHRILETTKSNNKNLGSLQ